ncbi:IS3 family transposase [Flavobacterium oreochromis]
MDNTIIENFFGILKSEIFCTQKFKSIKQLKQEIISILSITITSELN